MAGNQTDITADLRFYNRNNTIVMVEGITALIILFFTLFGNLFILSAFVHHKDTRTNFKLYGISHVIADTILATVAMPFSVAALFQSKWPFSSTWCSFQGIVATWSCEASIVTMTLVAVHRYTKMLQTSFHRRFYTKRFIILSLVLGWLFAIIGPVAYILKGGAFVFVSAFVVCTFDYQNLDIAFAMWMVLLLSALPFTIITLCYYKVWRFVQQHNTRMQSRSISVEEIRITKLVSMVLLSFIICWAPLVVVVVIIMFKGLLYVPRQLCVFVIFIASTFGCMNPIIHCTLFKEFRKFVYCCNFRGVVATQNRIHDESNQEHNSVN